MIVVVADKIKSGHEKLGVKVRNDGCLVMVRASEDEKKQNWEMFRKIENSVVALVGDGEMKSRIRSKFAYCYEVAKMGNAERKIRCLISDLLRLGCC